MNNFLNSLSTGAASNGVKNGVSSVDMLYAGQDGKSAFVRTLESSQLAAAAFDPKCPIIEPSAWFARFALDADRNLTKSAKGDTVYIPAGDSEFVNEGGIDFENGVILQNRFGFQLRCSWTAKNVVALMQLLARDMVYNNGVSAAFRAQIPILSKIQFPEDCTFNDQEMIAREDCIRLFFKSSIHASLSVAGPFQIANIAVSSISSTTKGRVAGYKLLKITNPEAPAPMDNFQQQTFTPAAPAAVVPTFSSPQQVGYNATGVTMTAPINFAAAYTN